MIRIESKNELKELTISGNSDLILDELHIILLKVLESFYKAGADILVLQMLIDVTEEFKASITNKNFNSKGEKKDD